MNKIPIYGFMHIACMNHWRDVVTSQIERIKRSGLLEATDRTHLGIVGPFENIQIDPEFVRKSVVGAQSKFIDLYEFPTLSLIDGICRAQECVVWYIHTKGVSYPDRREESFRDTLEEVSIDRWRDCLAAIQSGNDAAGAIWQPNFSYRGNFWWSSSRHIRDLARIRELNWKNRDGAETWMVRLKKKRPLKMVSLTSP